MQVTAEEQGLPLTQHLYLYDLRHYPVLRFRRCSPKSPQGSFRLREKMRSGEGGRSGPWTGPVMGAHLSHSSPIMWPQPPQPLSEPSGVDEPAVGACPRDEHDPTWKGHRRLSVADSAQSSELLTGQRTDRNQPKQGITTQLWGLSPASFLPEDGGPRSQRNSSHIEPFSKEESSLCLHAQPAFK